MKKYEDGGFGYTRIAMLLGIAILALVLLGVVGSVFHFGGGKTCGFQDTATTQVCDYH